MNRTLTALRVAAGARAAWGLALVAVPGRTAALVCAGRPQPQSWIVRVLGLRLLAQSAWVLLSPSRARLRGAAAIDAVHAASMAGVAAAWPRYRRAAAVSGTGSASAAVVALLASTDRR